MRKLYLIPLLLLVSTLLSAASMEVLVPGGGTNLTLVQQFVAIQPTVSGFVLHVQWADFDNGSGSYNFTSVDNTIAQWKKFNKKVNVVLWANADVVLPTCSNYGLSGVGNCAIPSYVWTKLGSTNYVSCSTQSGTQRFPNYISPVFIGNYQKAIAALMKHLSGIGYLRVGLGRGGETLPVMGWQSTTTACGQAFTRWGVTVTSWESYLSSMLHFEAAQPHTYGLQVGVTPMPVGNSKQVPDYVASIAASLNIGFGSQGLQKSDVNNCKNSVADWCMLFAKYPTSVHELQTVAQSCSNNLCQNGSLTTLLPWATANGAKVIELYFQDWLTAYAPTYPGYTKTYAAAIVTAAAAK